MSCEHKTNVTQQRFQVFTQNVTVTFCHDCRGIVNAVDDQGQPWTMPRTRDEIGLRLSNVAAGLLEKLAKRLRGPT